MKAICSVSPFQPLPGIWWLSSIVLVPMYRLDVVKARAKDIDWSATPLWMPPLYSSNSHHGPPLAAPVASAPMVPPRRNRVRARIGMASQSSSTASTVISAEYTLYARSAFSPPAASIWSCLYSVGTNVESVVPGTDSPRMVIRPHAGEFLPYTIEYGPPAGPALLPALDSPRVAVVEAHA